MGHFYGAVRGGRGEATRLGGKNSDMDARAQGWKVGARIQVFHRDGKDVVRVWRTDGSEGVMRDLLIAEFDADTPAGLEAV